MDNYTPAKGDLVECNCLCRQWGEVERVRDPAGDVYVRWSTGERRWSSRHMVRRLSVVDCIGMRLGGKPGIAAEER